MFREPGLSPFAYLLLAIVLASFLKSSSTMVKLAIVIFRSKLLATHVKERRTRLPHYL